ncbi:MAG: type II toxin-antitoxin system RelE/ParE family toxin [Clostridia bacterium]|nr:type II toxin-antitoxin system RelE/ParE family toxin [Clostridia bacterium]
MGRVTVSREARRDLVDIRNYIRDELCNPDAAARIMGRLRTAMESLRSMPERGMPLDAILSVHTDYRFLVCEQYRLFYLTDGKDVEVIRVLHVLRDPVRALFLGK